MDEAIRRPRLALGLTVAATVLELLATGLVLPAVPFLPEMLGGSPAAAQLVLAGYVTGTCIGLMFFGALGDRLSTRTLFVGSLLLMGLVSLAAAAASSIGALVALRVLQGAVAAAPAVYAPAIIRLLFDERGAIRAMGALGSIEGLAPALAPILGAWLLTMGGWRISFILVGVLALLLTVVNFTVPVIPQVGRRTQGNYRRLLIDPVYLRYALSHAFTLGGLLVFVFGAPAVLVRSFGGSVSDFITMQITGIATFILCANLTGNLSAKFGAERMIALGSALAMASAGAMLAYGFAGGTSAGIVIALFVPINSGLGLRGPPGFYRAIAASRGDDARAGALTLLFIMAVSGGGTALVAPFITQGLLPLAAATFVLQMMALLLLLLPGLAGTEETAMVNG
jgi:DHA1 family bicyclomycin/chloramphenicol resistance-like MFS transporter